MAEEVILKVGVNTGNSVEEVNELTRAEEKLAQETKNVSKAFVDSKKEIDKVLNSTDSFENKLDSLNKTIKNAPANMRDMNKQIQAYQSLALQAGRETPVGRQALAEASVLKDRMVDLQNETKRLSDDQKNLKGVMQIGQTTLAGYGALQGVIALTGGESEKLRETLVKLQAVQTTLTSLDQIRTALQKESNAMLLINNARTKVATTVQTAYTLAVGNSTGAMKALRLAMLAVPLVAIAGAVALLVANWDKVTEALGFASKAQTEMNDVSKQANDAIADQLSASDKLQKTLADTTKSEEERVQAVKDLQAEYPDLLANVDAEKDGLDAVSEALELNTELLKLNAQVKAIADKRSEAYKQQLDAEVDAQTGANEGIINSIQAWTLGTGAKDLAIAKSKQIQKESQNEIDVLDDLEKGLQDQIKALKDKGAVDADDLKAQKENNDKRKKLADEATKRAEKEAQLRKERQKLLEDYMVQSIEDESLRKIEKLRIAHERERQTLIEKFGQDSELLKELTEKQNAELTALNNELAKKEAEAQKKLDEEAKKKREEEAQRKRNDAKAQLEGELLQLEQDFTARQNKLLELAQLEREQALEQDRLTAGEKFKIEQEYQAKVRAINKETVEHNKQLQKDAIEARVKITQQGLGSLQNLSDAVFNIRMSRLKKGSREEEKLAKKRFKINKALQLAGAITDGYKAITASLASAPVAIGGVPNPAGIASLAFATTTTLANIAKIASTRYEGGSSGGGASTGVIAPSIPTVDTTGGADGISTLTEGLTGSGNEGGSNVVLVVDSVTKAISEKNQVETISSIG